MQTRSALAAAIAAIATQAALADQREPIEEMVVTGVRTAAPLQLITNPKAPRQPLPAHDGADYLKTIPGFSVIRKGGTDGDPVLRGMAGSRLSMLMDGEVILGGCNNRMDPPTAYVFPETFDSIKVIKGPQSVQYGPGNSAGVVLFERNSERPQSSEWKLHSSVLGGSFGRHDEVIDLLYRSPDWEVRASGSNAASDNYRDGDGTEIHSRYERWNAQLNLAWTPDELSRLEFSTAASNGEAAYADRGVDGSKYSRENYSLKFSRDFRDSPLESVELQAYYNYVDHVMDNYSLRRPEGMMANGATMNPDRETTGGKAVLSLAPTATLSLTLGGDLQRNRHSARNTMNETLLPYRSLPRTPDARFDQRGLFLETRWDLAPDSRLLAGLRADRWQVTDQRRQVALGMMSTAPNPLADFERGETLESGFLRFENDLSAELTWYAGVGRNSRFPDYWEITKEGADALAVTDTLKAERNTQVDTGLLLRTDRLEASLSLFHSDVRDYIMIQSGVMKPAAVSGMDGMGGMGGATQRSTTIARNIDARSWGLEFDSQYRFSDNWRAELTLASVRGANDTDGTTLAQLPPLEARLGLYYDNRTWSAGLLWRSLAAQDRVDIGKGNIVGQDFGPTASADVLSFNAGWKISEEVLLTAGIDNLLDESYAEHVSRAGAAIAGFDQIARVNEPGRTLWMKAQYSF